MLAKNIYFIVCFILFLAFNFGFLYIFKKKGIPFKGTFKFILLYSVTYVLLFSIPSYFVYEFLILEDSKPSIPSILGNGIGDIVVIFIFAFVFFHKYSKIMFSLLLSLFVLGGYFHYDVASSVFFNTKPLPKALYNELIQETPSLNDVNIVMTQPKEDVGNMYKNAQSISLFNKKNILIGEHYLEKYTYNEMKFLILHEYGHIKSRHSEFSVIFGTLWFIGFFLIISQLKKRNQEAHPILLLPIMGNVLVVYCIVSIPLLLGIIRQSEYNADTFAVKQMKTATHAISTIEKFNISKKKGLIKLYTNTHPSNVDRMKNVNKLKFIND